MIVFPNCKINLGLNILRKREDGFHDLETVFYPLQIKDAVEIIQTNSSKEIEYSSSGIIVDGHIEANLCIKAYHLLKKDFPELPSIKMHLHKTIPMGAGLGGGSADAAFTLNLINTKFNLNLSTSKLLNYATQLGSDCPFFIMNKPSLATGRGEILEQVDVDLTAYRLIIINPGIHINTGWAFTQLTPALPKKSIKEIIKQPITTWKDEMLNDFEKPVFEKYPEIKSIKETLYSNGALYAAMSGSGSSVFGIFENKISPVEFADKNYFIKIVSG